MKVFLSIGAFLLASTTLVAAFSFHPLQSSCARVQMPAATFTVFAAEDDSEVGSAEDSAAATSSSEEAPKVAVKCPDCDLCDGSGR